MGIRNATLIMAATQPARYGIHDILEEAVEINRISDRRPAAPLGPSIPSGQPRRVITPKDEKRPPKRPVRKQFRVSYDRIVSFDHYDDGFGIMRDAQTAKPQGFQLIGPVCKLKESGKSTG